MKYFNIILIVSLLTSITFSQTFEIRTVDNGGGQIGVEMRETSGGTNTPTTTDGIADITFGIKWLASYNIDLTMGISSYNITKSGTEDVSVVPDEFQAFGISVPLTFPSNWTQNLWVEILSIPNNLTGTGTGTFEICEVGFHSTTDPNITVLYDRLTRLDLTPAITGFATNIPLPVELSSFKVNSVEGAKAQLEWETATEVNNYGFDIERSIVAEEDAFETESYDWEKVSFVEGHGNSNSPKLYSFTDKNLVGNSKFVYRLKQIDIDGTFEYSDAVEVEVLPTKYELMQNYPNPFNPSTKIKFSLPEDAKIAINIYNILGEKVASILNKELKAGFHQVDFNSKTAGYGIASGVYIYTIQTKNFSQVKKMILMK
jgi:Secretion system C-terminal sorting domain